MASSALPVFVNEIQDERRVSQPVIKTFFPTQSIQNNHWGYGRNAGREMRHSPLYTAISGQERQDHLAPNANDSQKSGIVRQGQTGKDFHIAETLGDPHDPSKKITSIGQKLAPVSTIAKKSGLAVRRKKILDARTVAISDTTADNEHAATLSESPGANKFISGYRQNTEFQPTSGDLVANQDYRDPTAVMRMLPRSANSSWRHKVAQKAFAMPHRIDKFTTSNAFDPDMKMRSTALLVGPKMLKN